MKTPYAIGLMVVSVLITTAIEETRISALRSNAKTGEQAATSKALATVANAAVTAGEETPVRSTKKPRPDTKLAGAATVTDSDDESFARTARKMWDNPAGKSMMNQGVKMAVGMMYQDFIDSLDLTKEEAEYFKNLLGKEMTGQQELGMKMLGATDEERKTLAEEITKRGQDNEEEIKAFLNNGEDYKKYSDYKNHLPEHQQLDGIRTAMTTKGAPLDAETETRLVDAMYRARTESNVPNLSGPGAIDQLAKGNLVETFEQSWDKQQAALQAETSKILNETQMAAFQDYQKQTKEMQLMGLKMAEKMMPGKKDGTK